MMETKELKLLRITLMSRSGPGLAADFMSISRKKTSTEPKRVPLMKYPLQSVASHDSKGWKKARSCLLVWIALEGLRTRISMSCAEALPAPTLPTRATSIPRQASPAWICSKLRLCASRSPVTRQPRRGKTGHGPSRPLPMSLCPASPLPLPTSFPAIRAPHSHDWEDLSEASLDLFLHFRTPPRGIYHREAL